MYYDLDALMELSDELGFNPCRMSHDVLEVIISDGIILCFENLRDKEDTMFGFKGTSWHSHGKLVLMVDNISFVELDELDILMGLKNGDLLIIERYLNERLEDRWLSHQRHAVNVEYMQIGEEIRIRRTNA
ncbi:MAG: hypothetical protein R3A44_36205 [Caldilineaceae bacterium]